MFDSFKISAFCRQGLLWFAGSHSGLDWNVHLWPCSKKHLQHDQYSLEYEQVCFKLQVCFSLRIYVSMLYNNQILTYTTCVPTGARKGPGNVLTLVVKSRCHMPSLRQQASSFCMVRGISQRLGMRATKNLKEAQRCCESHAPTQIPIARYSYSLELAWMCVLRFTCPHGCLFDGREG